MSSDTEPSIDDYDATIGGERKSVEAGTIDVGIEIAGERTSTTATPGKKSIEVFISGDSNTLRIPGEDEEIVLYLTGDHNSLIVAEGMSVTTKLDEGASTSIKRQEFESAGDTDKEPELIEQTKNEAYASVGLFGIDVITYQTEATEREWCRYCGRDADTVVQRHEERVLAVFGLRFQLEQGGLSDECEHCTTRIDPDDVKLTEDERRQVYR
jgi:hypothetical protein